MLGDGPYELRTTSRTLRLSLRKTKSQENSQSPCTLPFPSFNAPTKKALEDELQTTAEPAVVACGSRVNYCFLLAGQRCMSPGNQMCEQWPVDSTQ